MTRRHARGGITEGDWNFVARETIAEKADVRKEDEVVIETVETRPCYYTDQEVVAVDNQEKIISSGARFDESCSTVTSLKMSVKPGLNKLSRQ